MRNTLILILLVSFSWLSLPAQDWKHVHKDDDNKWAKETGLDPMTIHKLCRSASSAADEKDDDSRIANLDVEGLAERHDVLLVTYAGEKNCLTLTVFRMLTETKFTKVWSASQPPDATGFCDNAYGTPTADAMDGVVRVRVTGTTPDGAVRPMAYVYEWNGITYRFAGKKEIQER